VKRTGIKRGKAKGRARPGDQLADWCQWRIYGVCTGRAEHRHHIIPRSQGGADEAGNTADVCGACHTYAHMNRDEARQQGWIKRKDPCCAVIGCDNRATWAASVGFICGAHRNV
jgi:5-methylcytosine-specific restriction endonuclease McrA